MAIPILYWMLECTGCHCRFVVHDCYLVFVGSSRPDPAPGEGYGGPPLPMRYTCVRGCADALQALGSTWEPDDDSMWLREPHVPVRQPESLRREWRYLAGDPTRFVQTPFPLDELLRATL